MDDTIKSDRYGVAWVAREDRILSEVYPVRGAAGVVELLPHRTRIAVAARARLNRVRAPGRWRASA